MLIVSPIQIALFIAFVKVGSNVLLTCPTDITTENVWLSLYMYMCSVIENLIKLIDEPNKTQFITEE